MPAAALSTLMRRMGTWQQCKARGFSTRETEEKTLVKVAVQKYGSGIKNTAMRCQSLYKISAQVYSQML